MSETRPYIYRVISPQHTSSATLYSLFSFDAQEHTVKKHFPSCVCRQILANHGWTEKKEGMPISRELIKLAKRQQALENVAFSAAPTSSNCFLFTIENVAPTVVAISTCRPGDAVWTNLTYHSNLPFISSIWNKVVFSNGLFYCLSLHSMLGVFYPVNQGWTVTTVLPPKCTDHLSVKHWPRGKFMAEHDRDIFVDIHVAGFYRSCTSWIKRKGCGWRWRWRWRVLMT